MITAYGENDFKSFVKQILNPKRKSEWVMYGKDDKGEQQLENEANMKETNGVRLTKGADNEWIEKIMLG